MSRYIDAELIEYTNWREYCATGAYVTIKDINKIPTADVVEVVRCKDCRFYDMEWKLCQHQRTGRAPDWYCASGRTKG